MQFWAIIKLIAGIIANLPFDASEKQVEEAVTAAVEECQGDVSVANVGIPATDWEELIKLLTPVLLWFLRRFSQQ
jgi:hypothetical protein